MKNFMLALLLPSNLYALTVPKSSLEVVKSDVVSRLDDAQKTNNSVLIKKYQDELKVLDQKIKHFELEWLQYRKRQLSVKPVSTEIVADLAEIDKLISLRS